jgi:hypothetical protein
MYEFEGAAFAWPIAGGAMTFTSGDFIQPVFKSPFGVNDIVIGAFEHNGIPRINIFAETGLTVDYQTPVTDDHSCTIFSLDTTQDGLLTGQMSSGVPTNPCFGLFAIVPTTGAN